MLSAFVAVRFAVIRCRRDGIGVVGVAIHAPYNALRPCDREIDSYRLAAPRFSARFGSCFELMQVGPVQAWACKTRTRRYEYADRDCLFGRSSVIFGSLRFQSGAERWFG